MDCSIENNFSELFAPKPSKRERKVTITEVIEDDIESGWSMINEDEDQVSIAMETDEAFRILDELVQVSYFILIESLCY